MRSFNEYALSQDYKSVREELANHLIESNVDVAKLNQVFDIINEEGWNYNPAKTGTEMGAAAAGATLGSALGPLGTVAGGVAGGLAGKAASGVMGKLFQGARVEPMEPVHKQAQQAIDKLMALLSKSPAEKISDEDHQKKLSADPTASKYLNSVAKIKNYLDNTGKLANQIDKYRNRVLDKSLKQGGGLSSTLKGIPGLKWLGKVIEKVPILNQDKGLRRSVAKSMDALQVWATQNPKKAAVLNAAAGAAGAATGVYGASKLQQAFTPSTQASREQPKPEPEQAIGDDSVTSRNAGEYLGSRKTSQAKGFSSGKVDNSAATGDDSATSSNAGEYLGSRETSQAKGLSSGKVDNSAVTGGEGTAVQYTTPSGISGDYSHNDKFGKFVVSKSPSGQTIYNSEDGNSYMKYGRNLFTKVDPQTGQATGRPSVFTDYLRKNFKKAN
jgi:hypothetical protein